MAGKKKYIWFDLGYTLLGLKRDTLFQNMLEELGFSIPTDQIEKAFHLTDKLFMRMYPGVLGKKRSFYMPIYMGNMIYTLGIRTDICPLYETWKKKLENPFKVWAPFDYVKDELTRLSKEGYKLGVISNWDKTAVPLLEQFKLTSLFDNIIISSEVGYEKPSMEIFQIALKQASISIEDCLYVGDNYYDDGVGSRAVGMDFVIVNPYGKLGVEEIKDCNVILDITYLREYL
ncbi:MAG: HAD-IA family hydrolase [Spirochaetia bacterium]|jgi:putative hydrolase of the HAD superfamily|nr:HAD-IA family hydrolase [Spirochaetia bacterium]